ncbi:class I SAM-dependent methyltransferase [Lentzea sp. NEAU-D7]|uniref:class I SAM-dependent methyltransferase n=1 Tax=Lentzea sp. NEAU-D7 TaxID=2994667 RepID=UPI00224A724B|nr:class I SAM-dependent methyltransferase [Lentzea sp. NEAU-D7]MCX2953798.1 class I SAM-dependent methyltransferase [Lentzea sp. NEAU-D7]
MPVDRFKSTWEDLGRVDPLWAVLTDPQRRNGGWELDEFLATATGPIASVRKLVDEAGLSFGNRVVDLGCGAGRLSNALAAHVHEVVGVDVAQSMVDEANRINQFPDRVSFVAYDGYRLPFADESFDSALSLISLQHSPPALQVQALLELQRVVRPGGVLVIQLPCRPTRREELPEEGMRAGIELLDVPAQVGAGQTVTVRARVTNVSAHTWPSGQLIRLGNHWLKGDEPVTWDDGRADLPHDLAPGAAVELNLEVVAPEETGEHHLELDVVQEAVTWWAAVGSTPASTGVTVVPDAVPIASASGAAQEVVIAAQQAPHQRKDGGIEMFGVDTNLVRLLFAHCGSQVVDIVADDMAGDDWESFTYVIRRGETV